MNTQNIYINILSENWRHMRHQETQRMWIANVFVALVVGVSAYLGKVELEELSWFVPLAFLIISVLCLLITLKLNHIFGVTKDAISDIFEDKKILLEDNWGKYVGGLKSKGKWEHLKVRCLYVILYSIAIVISLILLVLTLTN
ncbi:MAG: hypothetical protein ABIH70_09810 [Chloroflexota bacterium]